MELLDLGYKPVLLGENSKVPLMKNWPDVEVTQKEIKNHIGNLGIKTGKLVAIDIDDKESAREFYKVHQSILKTCVETRKGAHFWFQSDEEIGNKKHQTGDIRGIGGQVLIPDSEVNGWKYKYINDPVPIEELPVFDWSMVDLISEKTSLTREQVKNVDNYISKIKSIQGQNGSGSLMRAIYICRDAGLNEAETMIRLVRWNETNCTPRWSDKELARAVTNAMRRLL